MSIPRRAVEHRQRRAARDRRHRRAPRTRAGRRVGVVGGEGRPGRRRARRASVATSGVARDDRRRRAAGAEAGLHRHTAMADNRLPEAIEDLERFLARRHQRRVERPGVPAVPRRRGARRADRPDRRRRPRDGGASLFVNGVDPGFANDWLPLVLTVGLASASTRCAAWRSSTTPRTTTPMVLFDIMGFGEPLDETPMLLLPGVLTHGLGLAWSASWPPASTSSWTRSSETVRAAARAGDVRDRRPATIEKGTTAALRFEVLGMRRRRARRRARARHPAAPTTSARTGRSRPGTGLLPRGGHRRAELHPRPADCSAPTATTTPPGSRPPPCGWSTRSPAVVAAPPGLLTALDLPSITGRGLVG